MKKDNSRRVSLRKNYKDEKSLRHRDHKDSKMVEARDNKRKSYFKYEEKAYKKLRLVDDGVVYEFTILKEETFERIKDQGLLKVPF